jgi:AcrR family transcriptional regulator
LRLADKRGVDALTMRRLARELGVEAMSLYNHVGSKGELVDAIVELVVEEIELPGADAAWDAAIKRCAISAHETFIRHPWACSLAMGASSTAGPRDARLRYMEWLLGRLRDAGFTPEATYHAYHAIDAHIFGFTLWQLAHAQAVRTVSGRKLEDLVKSLAPKLREQGYAHVAEHGQQHLDAEPGESAREFEFGLDLILAGLRGELR